ncbi:hypothetical protein JYQ29_00515 [Curtobacterium flaccumfaciens pv. flaccumfaciens]|uniref:hypothetical protein n=1 Tax=Curtobacterium flaccumfaciens TaxID=2035 RepID=UPI001ADB8DD7|nr:hypothetical protein [Curtobacterium flaccumfaciens]MBO9055463.1 hypothetical protein [Curtobacterium flaccumfaciens pv. flaccumfaciens]QTR90997.1 hypothetical protein JG550_000197 [Curtobacterium flaccumfaciens pv. flaccumfaciens]QVG66314.1 hypothetical protein JG551_000195 [Curtobacterium flaccumfaciens pv. flaccumfaciens]
MSDMWGQVVPGWLSAIGTVGATAAAAWGLWRAERATSRARIAAAAAEDRTRQLEAEERDRQRIADERAQAERVDVSETRVPFEVVDEPEAGPASAASLTGGPVEWEPAEHDVGRDGLVTVAEVLNTSPRPISDITLFWMAPGGNAQLDSRHIDA